MNRSILNHKSVKRYVSILMIGILLMTVLPIHGIGSVRAEESGTVSGTGTADNPYLVSTYKELRTYLPQGYVKMMSDISVEYSVYIGVTEQDKEMGLDLNGHILDFSESYGQYGISVSADSNIGASFTISDSSPETEHGAEYVTEDNTPIRGGIITQFHHDSLAGGFTSSILASYVALTVEDVTFFKNVSRGGGTCIGLRGDADLTVKNVNFYNNESRYWSGCIWYTDWYESNNSTCTISGCTFENNYGRFSSTVNTSCKNNLIENCVFKNNRCEMYGTINVGGSVSAIIKDTVIMDNVATGEDAVAGLAGTSNSNISFDGKVVITGNVSGKNKRNVYTRNPVTLEENFNGDSKIGLTLNDSLAPNSSRVMVKNIGDYAACFTCDEVDGILYAKGTQLLIKNNNHVHRWKYAAQEAVLSAYCVETEASDGCAHQGSADDLKNAIRHTLVPMRLMYSGNAQEYPLTDWREYDDGLSELVVRYYLADGVTETDTDNSGAASAGGAPVKTGTYIVKVAAVEDETQAAVTSLVITAPHEAATEWSTDTENHWHACAAEGCIDHIYDVGTHSFERGICTVCGYADPDYHEHALGTYHAEVPATCMAAGTKAYYECANGCESKLDADGNEITDITIPMKAHDFSNNAKVCRNGCNTANPNYIVPTESETPAPTEPETPVPTEPETPAPTEPETPAPTEPETPAPTEPETPAPTEPETPAPTEPTTSATTPVPTEPTTPVPTEPTTPVPTERTTEAVSKDAALAGQVTTASVKQEQQNTNMTGSTEAASQETPKTGDTDGWILWTVLFAGSLLIVFINSRKSERKVRE